MIVSVEKQKDGTYIAYNTDEDGLSLIGTGATVSEAKSDFLHSMEETAEACRDAGLPVHPALGKEPDFKFDIASLFEYYSMINVSAFARYLGLNEALLRQYKSGGVYISDAQLRKIENGLHALGNDFSRLKLV